MCIIVRQRKMRLKEIRVEVEQEKVIFRKD